MNGRPGRPRIARRALAAAQRAPVGGSARSRIAAALALCSETARHVVALLVQERLSARETALALGLPLRRVTRIRSTLLGELRRVLRGRPFRRTARSAARPALDVISLRRAS